MKVKVVFSILSALLVLLGCIGGSNTVAAATSAGEQQPKDDDDDDNEKGVNISRNCATVLLVTAGVSAGAISVLTPVAACTAGFCQAGVAGGSFAAWWQSTMPLVAKGSLFAKLQALAMSGSGMQGISVTAGALGGTVAAGYVEEFCAMIDEADPDSATARATAAAVTAYDTVGKTISDLKTECTNSESCTSAVNSVKDAATQTKEFVASSCASSETCRSTLEFGSRTMKTAYEKLIDYALRLGEKNREK